MENTICFKSNYFWLTFVLLIIAIAFIIYKVYEKYQQIHDVIDKISDNIKNIYVKSKNLPTQEKENPEDITYERDPPNRFPIERRFPTRRPILNYDLPMANYDLPMLNTPNYGNFQLVGYVHRRRNPDQMFRLMCRQINTGRYEYYVIQDRKSVV